MKTRGHRRSRRGGGYGFGGSILGDDAAAGAGNALWNSDTSQDCGSGQVRPGNSDLTGGKRRRRRGGSVTNESLLGRGGNNPTGGKRSRRNLKKKARRTRRRLRGGMGEGYRAASDLAMQAPRTGYGFDGTGVAGTANTIPYQ